MAKSKREKKMVDDNDSCNNGEEPTTVLGEGVDQKQKQNKKKTKTKPAKDKDEDKSKRKTKTKSNSNSNSNSNIDESITSDGQEQVAARKSKPVSVQVQVQAKAKAKAKATASDPKMTSRKKASSVINNTPTSKNKNKNKSTIRNEQEVTTTPTPTPTPTTIHKTARSSRRPRRGGIEKGFCTPTDLANNGQHMLFVPCKLEDGPSTVELLVDSGAANSAISSTMAEQLGLLLLLPDNNNDNNNNNKLNTGMAGSANGVGSTSMLGVLENIKCTIGHVDFRLYFTVLVSPAPILILGLDQIRRLKCCIDLEKNTFSFGGGGGGGDRSNNSKSNNHNKEDDDDDDDDRVSIQFLSREMASQVPLSKFMAQQQEQAVILHQAAAQKQEKEATPPQAKQAIILPAAQGKVVQGTIHLSQHVVQQQPSPNKAKRGRSGAISRIGSLFRKK